MNQLAAACAGDCDGDGTVTVDEIILAVRGALAQDAASCAGLPGSRRMTGQLLRVDAGQYL